MSISGPTSDHNEIERWADRNNFIPIEKLPSRVDGEPAELCLIRESEASRRKDVSLISWDDFFIRFDQHGLAFVYDDDSTGYNELLQIEGKSPYRQQAFAIKAN